MVLSLDAGTVQNKNCYHLLRRNNFWRNGDEKPLDFYTRV